MTVRIARSPDFSRIRNLAARENLDHEGMDRDRFWVAVEDGRTVGACGLTEHPDCLGLRSSAVEEASRGWGRRRRFGWRYQEAAPFANCACRD